MKFKETLIEPAKTALIVVDMQNDYCHPDGACARRGSDVSRVATMVPHLKALLEGARANGTTVIFIQTFHEYATDSEAWTARSDGRSGEICRTGSWGAEFYDVLPQPGDIIINKHRYSAFINTRLDSVLRSLKIETLIMTGVSTNVCVESTARQGYMLDYNIVMAEDACAAFSRKAHEMTLENIDQYFGCVVTVQQVLETWERLAARATQTVAAG